MHGIMAWLAQCAKQAAFEYLANDLVLPAVRSSLVNEWEVRAPAPALELAEAMVLAGVGDGIVQTLLEQAILPKLTRGVTEWNPRTDTVAIHTWIHPWLPLLGSRLAGKRNFVFSVLVFPPNILY